MFFCNHVLCFTIPWWAWFLVLRNCLEHLCSKNLGDDIPWTVVCFLDHNGEPRIPFKDNIHKDIIPFTTHLVEFLSKLSCVPSWHPLIVVGSTRNSIVGDIMHFFFTNFQFCSNVLGLINGFLNMATMSCSSLC